MGPTDTVTKKARLENLEERLRGFISLVYRERNDMLVESDKRFREVEYSKKGKTLDERAKVGDVVYLKKAEKHEEAVLGVIQEMRSETTCIVKTKMGEVTRMTLDCHPLVIYRAKAGADSSLMEV